MKVQPQTWHYGIVAQHYLQAALDIDGCDISPDMLYAHHRHRKRDYHAGVITD